MTELQAKDPRAPHASGAAPSPTHAGSPLLGRLDPCPFQGNQPSDASSVVSPVSISLDDRLLFPRPCQGLALPGGKAQDQQSLSDVEGSFPGVEATREAGGSNPRAPEKDSRLLDSVLDTLLAPSDSEQSHASPPACEVITSWCLFGSELPEDPRSVPATKGLLSPLMNRAESKAGDSSGTGAGQKVLPKGLSPPRQLLLPTSGSTHWPGSGVKPSPQPPALEVEEDCDLETESPTGPLLKSKPRALEGTGSGGVAASAPAAVPGGVTLVPKEDSRFSAPRGSLEQDASVAPGRSPLATTVVDFIHVPILPLNHALLAARTRQLLEGDSYDGGASAQGSFAAPRGSPSAPSTPVPCGDFPDCTYPQDGDPKEDAFPLYGDFQPPGLKIKEEEEGAEAAAAARSPRPYLVAGASAATFPDFPLAPAPPRAHSSRPGEAAVAGGPGSSAVSPASSSGSALECILYKAEGAPPTQGPFPPLPCKPPASGSCLLPRDSLPAPQAASAAPAIYPPLGLNGLPQLGYQTAVIKDSLPQVYPPYLNYLRTLDGVALPQSVGLPNESQPLGQRITFSPSQEMQLIPPLINLLMSIEPDVIYAGHDNTKPDTSSSLLTSLNQLGERQLLSVVKWSKSLPGFRNLHIDDQITLIQYSWMSLMVFGLGWRSYKHVSGQMLYFAPDLILNEQRMKESSFYSLCLTMWQIPQEFVKLQVTQEEFLCMKVLLLLNTIPLEGLRSQSQFEEMRSSYIRELIKAIGLRQKGVVPSSQRFYQLTKLLDSLHDLVKQLHLYCLNTFIQSRTLAVEFPEMMSEVIAAQLPKILAGMVKPLLFHKK
ncbi:Pgr [Phodopus roborovskii]|uniref:Pgr protein n=1 Tax=Phodopus roborovskii TaxID=109678 RepID=A0AAU9YSY1_PHORO|nr:Pgr [Phodopus roborovskii]